MTLDEKRTFITDLMNDMRDTMLQQTARMPEDWTGRELRQFITDYVTGHAGADIHRLERGALREYRNAIYTRNIG